MINMMMSLNSLDILASWVMVKLARNYAQSSHSHSGKVFTKILCPSLMSCWTMDPILC